MQRDITFDAWWRFTRQYLIGDDCWEWQGKLTPDGYGYCSFMGRTHLAHRVMFLLVRGRWPKDCALHRCDNPRCGRPDHLWEGDRAANNADRDAKGRTARGARHGRWNPGSPHHLRGYLIE